MLESSIFLSIQKKLAKGKDRALKMKKRCKHWISTNNVVMNKKWSRWELLSEKQRKAMYIYINQISDHHSWNDRLEKAIFFVYKFKTTPQYGLRNIRNVSWLCHNRTLLLSSAMVERDENCILRLEGAEAKRKRIITNSFILRGKTAKLR